MPFHPKEIVLLLLSSVLVSSDASSSGKRKPSIKRNEEIADDTEEGQEKNDSSLGNKWTLWFENKSNKERNRSLNKTDYLNHINKAGTFDTITGFWDCWNEVQVSCAVDGDCNYLLFKQGIKPVWEDPKNIKGGKCFVVIPNSSHEEKTKQWISLLLTLLIGEDEINGAVLSSRSWGNMFAVWTRTSDKKVVDVICKKMHDLFGDVQVKFQRHQAMIRKKFKPRGGRTSPDYDHEHSFSHSDSDDEHDKITPCTNTATARRSVVTNETKGMLHNLIAEVMEAPVIPPINEMHLEPAKDVPPMLEKSTNHVSAFTLPGTAGHATITHSAFSITKDKKRRRTDRAKKEQAETRNFDVHKGLSTLQKVSLGVLLLVGGVATSALSWIYL
jgi:translation initiation factor 4E